MTIHPHSLHRFFIWVILSLAGIGSAQARFDVPVLTINPNGTFKIDQIDGHVAHFDLEWKRIDQTRQKHLPGWPKANAQSWETQGTLSSAAHKAPLILNSRFDRIDASSFGIRYLATHKEGLPTKEMFLQLELPLALASGHAVTIDGEAHVFPVEFEKAKLFATADSRPRTIVLPGATGTVVITGTFSVLVQDQRQWKRDSYSLRLRFSPESDSLTKADLALTIRHTPYVSTPVPLGGAANFGFRDDVAGDARGGWTDQGPDNDLRMLPSGPLKAAGVFFDILDDVANDGHGAIVLGKSDQTFLPRSADVLMPINTGTSAWRNLYLLHASAWLPPPGKIVGHVVLLYGDGTESRQEIASGRDVGNWWSPIELSNARVGWTGVNSQRGVGLYVTKIPLGERPVEKIRFEATGQSMWMIAGVSGSPENIAPYAPAVPWTAAAGPDWAEHDHRMEIEAGSVFDFSGQLDAPAGRHGGLIITPAGHFEFEHDAGKRVRFWGVNLSFSANFLEKEEADHLAERFARSGYNSVRFHHYDRELQLKGGASHELDPVQLDRLDYLFAAMKKRGIYVNMDLYTSRTFSQEEFVAFGFDPVADTSAAAGLMHWRFKALMPVSELAFDTWSRFARNLMTHRNPYTGLTWAEDPALIGVCPVNEDSPRSEIDDDPVIKKHYQAAFETWLEKPEHRALADQNRGKAFNRFVFEAQIALDARMKAFLRDLGVKAPVTGTNMHVSQGLTLVRDHFDYVDNHQYWDHPVFPLQRFQAPALFHQSSAVSFAAQTPRSVMPTRILGKPFAVTEFNFVRPNRHRAEGGVIMPAYAGLQDWDSLYNFDYASSRAAAMKPALGGSFSIGNDPVGMIADRVAAALFLRGDIAPAKGEIGFSVQAETALSSRSRPFPDFFSRLGLVTRIGSRPVAPEALLRERSPDAVVLDSADYREGLDKKIYAADDSLGRHLIRDGVLPEGSISADNKTYVSDTGQIELQTETGIMKVVTPRSELFVAPSGARISGEFATVRNGSVFASVVVAAVDGKALAESGRLLITHLTDSLPEGTRFAAQDRRLMEARGALPNLIRRGSAELVLKLAEGGNYQAWAVATSGARLHEVPLTKTEAGWSLRAETVTKQGTQFAYEIVRL